ncbi:MAG: hypothetical protein Q9M19_08460 [Mariprofundaceae bacterium]|nr:hypothetical protein [Mariprofundaceae bacterium]
MNKKFFWLLIIGSIVFATLAATRSVWLDVEKDLTFLRAYIPKVTMLPQEKNEAYAQACAACHMLYMPSMLPARSWQKMMGELQDHFGDNAELEAAVVSEITAYLQSQAADKVENIYAQPMMALLKDEEMPMRASDTMYFKLLHDVVKPAMVVGNPDVTSFARCDTCHHEAVAGRFNKLNARIPNYFLQGVWKKLEQESKQERQP